MPVLREQRRRELSSHLWGPRPFGSKASGRWLESGALERERRSWTSDRSSSPVAERDERPPVAELQLGLEARSSAKSSPLRFGDSPGRAYGAGTGASSFGEVSVAHEASSLGEVSVASRGVFDQTPGRAGASSSFSYEAARFGFGDALTNTGSEPRSSRGFGFGEARELNFVSKAAQQQPGPFSEPGAFGSEAAPDAAERESALELGVLRGDWRAATGSSSAAATVAAGRRPAVAGAGPSPGAGSSPASVAGARASSSSGGPGGGGGGSGPSPGGGDAQSPPMSSGAPCGACKFLRRKCVRGCIFAPYFGAEQGAARFAAVHKIFGASNVSKLLLHIPLPKRCDAVLTISYEAQARISDPVYGCVATIFALQQQVASLQAELAMVQAQLASRLAAAALQQQHVQQHQQHQHQHQHQHHSATSAYDSSGISMTIPSPNQNIMTGAGGGSAGPYGGSSSRVKEEASFHTFHYDVGMGGSSMSIDSGANHGQHLLHLDSYNPGSQKMTTRHLLADHGRGEPDMGELQALAHALLRRK